MKTVLHFFKNPMILFMMIAALPMMSCDKNDDISPEQLMEQLEGTWDITSYKIAGDEYIGVLVENATISFHATADFDGDFTQTVVFFEEEEALLTGAYSVDSRGDEILLDYDGVAVQVELKIQGNKMTWKSYQDGYPLDLKATRR